jgi:glutathione S-transferase
MITLYSAGAGFGLPEISPYVTKTEVQLKIARLTYRKEQARPDDSPKGQLPYIDDDGVLVADSTFIRAHIERKYDFDFDAGLDAHARAEAWAVERMIENHLSWASAHARHLVPENFERGAARWFDDTPLAMRDNLRKAFQSRVERTLHAVGIGRHGAREIVELATLSLTSLSTLLGDKPYLMGGRPCGVDATTFGALAGILTPFFESDLRRTAERFDNLVAYVDRMMLRYYPEHPWPEPLTAGEDAGLGFDTVLAYA